MPCIGGGTSKSMGLYFIFQSTIQLVKTAVSDIEKYLLHAPGECSQARIQYAYFKTTFQYSVTC